MDKSLQNVIKHDQFVETVGEASEYVSGHRKQVAIYVGIAIVVATLGYGIWWYMSTQKAERQAALSGAGLDLLVYCLRYRPSSRPSACK